jgi:hypothetical protein
MMTYGHDAWASGGLWEAMETGIDVKGWYDLSGDDSLGFFRAVGTGNLNELLVRCT